MKSLIPQKTTITFLAGWITFCLSFFLPWTGFGFSDLKYYTGYNILWLFVVEIPKLSGDLFIDIKFFFLSSSAFVFVASPFLFFLSKKKSEILLTTLLLSMTFFVTIRLAMEPAKEMNLNFKYGLYLACLACVVMILSSGMRLIGIGYTSTDPNQSIGHA